MLTVNTQRPLPFFLSFPLASLVGAPESRGLLLASQSAHANKFREGVVKVGLSDAVHGLLGKESALVIAGDLNVPVLYGTIGEKTRA